MSDIRFKSVSLTARLHGSESSLSESQLSIDEPMTITEAYESALLLVEQMFPPEVRNKA